jgi:hypothetical protein
MKTHPQDFHYGGKLYNLYQNKNVSQRDGEALFNAHSQYILEPQLMASVLEALLGQLDEDVRWRTAGENRFVLGSQISKAWVDENTHTMGSFGMAHIKGREVSKSTAAKILEQAERERFYDAAFDRERIERDN